MNTTKAQLLARELMNTHGLGHWRFKFDTAVRRFGCCRYSRCTIQLSRPLTTINEESQVRDTILHEIAHALVPMGGHGIMWKLKCQQIGAIPKACCSASSVRVPAQRWQATCPGCGHVSYRARAPKRSRIHLGQMAEYTCGPCKRNGHGRVVVLWKINTPADIAKSNAQMVTQEVEG